MRPVKVEIWELDRPAGLSWVRTTTYSAGTNGQARALAREVLPRVYTTRYCYHRDTARADYAVLVRRSGHREIIDPEVVIQRSCSEAGYW